MPGPISTAFVELRADDSRLDRDVRDSSERAGETAGRGMGRGIARGLVGLAATVGVGEFFRQSVLGASDLGESLNAVNVVFGENAAGINAIGQSAADALGLTETQFNAMAVQFAGFAENIAGPNGDVVGTIDDLSTRAADFASVMNLEVADAVTVFQSGLAGETEALRRYGIDASDAAVTTFAYANGIAVAGEELTEAQKQQARYGLIMQETEAMAGDFANTQDSLANGMRRAKAQASELASAFGAGLLPAVESALVGVNDSLATLEPAMTAVGEAVGGALTPIFEQLGPTIDTALGFLPDILNDIGTIFGALAPLIQPIVELIGTVVTLMSGALAAAFEALAPVIEVVAEFIGDLADTLGDSLTPIIEALAPVLADIGEIFADVLGEVLPIIIDLFDALLPVIGEIADILGDTLMAVLPIIAEAFTTILDALKPLIPVFKDAFMRVLTALRPVLPVLATALAQVAVSLAEILVALTPLIPPLLDLAVVLIEELGVPILLAISEALVGISEAFAELAPIITSLVEGPLTDAINWVTQWLQESPLVQEIVQAISGYFQDLATFVQEAVDVVKAIMDGDWGEVWEQFKQLAVAALEVFLGTMDDIGPLLLEKLLVLWDTFIWPFLQDLPGLILDGLAALGTLLVDKGGDLLDGLWQGIQTFWDATLKPWFAALPGNIVGLIVIGGSFLMERGISILRAIWRGVVDFWDSTLSGWFTALPGNIVDLIKVVGSGLLGKGRDLLDALLTGIQGFWDTTLSPFFEDLPGNIVSLIKIIGSGLLGKGRDLLDAILRGIQGFWNTTLSPFFEDLPGNIADLIVTIGSGLFTKGRDILNAIGDGIESAWDTFKSFFSDIADTITGLLPSFDDLKGIGESIGGPIVSGLETILNGLITVYNNTIARIPGVDEIDLLGSESDVDDAEENARETGERIGGAVGEGVTGGIAGGMGGGGGGGNWQVLPTGFSWTESLLDGYDVNAFIKPGEKTMSGLQSGLATGQLTVSVFLLGLRTRLTTWLGNLTTTFVAAGIQLLQGLRAGMLVGQFAVQSATSALRSNLTTWLGNLTPLFTAAGIALMSGFRAGIVAGYVNVSAYIAAVRTAVAVAMSNSVSWWASAGIALMNGLRSGMIAGWAGVSGFIGNVRSALFNAMGNLYFAWYDEGVSLVRGLIDGVNSQINRVGALLFTLSVLRARLRLMSFAQGGWVPGSGPVPIMAHGGEFVVSKAMMEGKEGTPFGGDTINVGPLTFAGALPTPGQAQMIGEQIGDGIRRAQERNRIRTLAGVS